MYNVPYDVDPRTATDVAMSTAARGRYECGENSHTRMYVMGTSNWYTAYCVPFIPKRM